MKKSSVPEHLRNMSTARLALLVVSAAALVTGLVLLISWISTNRQDERAGEARRAIYHMQETETEDAEALSENPVILSGEEAAKTAAAAAENAVLPSETAAVEETALPAETLPAGNAMLPVVGYENNPGLDINARFKALRQENRDIVGWLSIGSMLDEAVVQRDNEFYMDHDISGNPNASGAVFLDTLIPLETRPYTLILYGHNMKTGTRFGSLRNYENSSFFRNYPYISFDTIYEDGKYIVFSVATVSMNPDDPNYLDYFGLLSRDPEERRQAIDILRSFSINESTIDVQPDDQLLVLVTCSKDDRERRLVSARRVRKNEN